MPVTEREAVWPELMVCDCGWEVEREEMNGVLQVRLTRNDVIDD